MNVLENFEKKQIDDLTSNKNHPDFYPGDTLKVHLKIKEGEKERIQIFEGVCISKKNSGLNSSFTMRKISYGEGVERVFPFYSPQISKIELSKSGDVRRSKLYYLRGRSGKSARITEKNKFIQQNKPSNLNEDQKKVKIDNTKVLKDSVANELNQSQINKTSDITEKKDSGTSKNT